MAGDLALQAGGATYARPGLLARLYPEMAAGGFHRHDSRVRFYARVKAILAERRDRCLPTELIVDLGAGNGSWLDRLGPYPRELCWLRWDAERVVGLDVDPVVERNATVGEAATIGADGRLPLADGSVDLVVAYAVLEHVEDPRRLAAEIRRVLRPGGWFCAWTPNRWGFVAIGARLVPNRWHARLLRHVSPDDRRAEADVFPTRYRMNTRAAIRRLFPGWQDATHTLPGPPSHNFGSAFIARAILAWQRLAPSAFAHELHVFVRRPGGAP